MKLTFNDIIDTHKDRVGLSVATGPSLKLHLNTIIDLSNSNQYTVLSVNECDTMFPTLNISYRVVANSLFTVAKEHVRFNREPKIPLVYANSVDMTPKNVVEQLLHINYLPYDQRHFGGNHCTWGNGVGGRHYCCNNIEEGVLTIQEQLKKYCEVDIMYGGGDTVSLHMLTFNILLGCNPIYIVGVDLDYSKGYADGISKNNDSFSPFIDRILDDFDIIKKSAENIGVEIYSLCEGSPINKIFKYLEKIN
jgi:hypothetical protein